MRSLFPKRGTAEHDLLKELLVSEEERICQQDPELWWMTDIRSMTEARRLCRDSDGQGTPCPLLNLCAEYAVTAGEPTGVWGGMTPEERHSERRRRVKAAYRARLRAERRAEANQTTTPEEQAS